jgi:hypothetical protein
LDKILGVVNFFSIQRIYSTSHLILLLIVLHWFVILVWALLVEFSRLLTYKASPLVLVALSFMKLPVDLSFQDSSLAFVIHFHAFSCFGASFLPLTLP